MDYEKLDFYVADFQATTIPFGLLFIGVVLCVAFAFYFAVEDTRKVKTRIIGGLMCASLATGGIFGITTTIDSQKAKSAAVKEHNAKASVNNLMKKYDLQEVKWDSADTTAGPKSTSGDGELLVRTNAGENYIFKYRVNTETSEPFLEDMPRQGGSTPEKTVTADSLLK